MSDGLQVLGGAAGVAADLADLRSTADLLDGLGSDLSALAGRTLSVAAAGSLLASAPLSPGTAARAEAALLQAAAGPQGLGALAVRLEGLAVVLRTRARLLQLADSGVDLLAATALRGAATLAGAAARTLVLPALAVTSLVVAGLYAGQVGEQVADLGDDLLRGRVDPADLDDRLRDVPGAAAEGLRDDVLSAVQDADLDARLTALLVQHPVLTDAVTGGLPDALRGAAGPAAPLLPDDLEGLVAALLLLGRGRGLFADAPVRARRRPLAAPGALRFTSLADLVSSQEQLALAVRDDPALSAVRVRRVDGPGGPRWVVQVPGTQEWAPRAGRDPSDLTSNLELMDDGRAGLADGVLQAMRDAGIGADDEVLLTGHSQGGLAAVALAGDPRVRAAFPGVGQVVTAGSPVGRAVLPEGVRVLSLEHTADPVPRLDGRPNPDAVGWTTVRRDLLDTRSPRPVLALDPVAHHDVARYAETAARVDASDDPALRPVLDGLAPFLTGRGETLDYVLDRPHP